MGPLLSPDGGLRRQLRRFRLWNTPTLPAVATLDTGNVGAIAFDEGTQRAGLLWNTTPGTTDILQWDYLAFAGAATAVVNRYPFLTTAAGVLNPTLQADFTAGTIAIGARVETDEYTQGSKVGRTDYVIVAPATGVADGGAYIDGVGFQLEAIFGPSIDIAQYGPAHSATVLTAFDNLTTYARNNVDRVRSIVVSPNTVNAGIWDLEDNWVIRVSSLVVEIAVGATVRTSTATTFGGTIIMSEGGAYGGSDLAQLTGIHMINNGAVIAVGSDNAGDPTGPGFDNAVSFGRCTASSYDGDGILEADRYALTLQINVTDFTIRRAIVRRARTAGVGIIGTADSPANFCKRISVDKLSIENVGLAGNITGKGLDIQHFDDVTVGEVYITGVTGRGFDARGTAVTRATNLTVNGPIRITESRQAAQVEFINGVRGHLAQSVGRAVNSYGLVLADCTDVQASVSIEGLTDALPSVTLRDLTGIVEFDATIINHGHIGDMMTITGLPPTAVVNVYMPDGAEAKANHPNALLLGVASAGATICLGGSVVAGTNGLVHDTVDVLSHGLIVDGVPWPTNARHLVVTGGGAVVLDPRGLDSIDLVLNANLTSIAWAGWEGDTQVSQHVRVQIVQDATGGWTVDPDMIDGTWVPTEPTVTNLTADDHSLHFEAFTNDDGTQVWLHPWGEEPIDLGWVTIDLAVVGATDLTFLGRDDTAGDTTDSEILWGDGASDVMDNSNKAHTYATPFTGNVQIRHRPATTINRLQFGGADQASWQFNLNVLSGLTGITNLSGFRTGIFGDITSLTTMTGLSFLQLGQSAVSGDISNLSTLPLTFIQLDFTAVNGPIGSLQGMPGLTSAQLSDTLITGSLADIATKTNWQFFYIGNTAITGDIASMIGNVGLRQFRIYDTAITGNISTLGTWTALQGFSAFNTQVQGDINVIAVASVPTLNLINYHTNLVESTVVELDNMLGTLAGGTIANGTITVNGVATPAPTNAAAIATLTGRTWTVTTN